MAEEQMLVPAEQLLDQEHQGTGVLVFRGQGVLSGDDQVRISMLFGAGEMHSTHGEHAKAGNEHIFRLSNKDGEGIVGE